MVRPQGIDVRVVPPSVPEPLTRMDVAAFVGFAAAGPPDTPVLVHGESHFREIFGDDQPLAWDAAAGVIQYAFLGPAVRSFFRNGGERCWVVRVAREPVTRQFEVPGVSAVDGGGGLVPYRLQARSPGSWADRLRLSTEVRREHLGKANYHALPDRWWDAEIAQDDPTPIAAGDLLEITFEGQSRGGGGWSTGGETHLYFAVERAEQDLTAGGATTTWRLAGQKHFTGPGGGRTGPDGQSQAVSGWAHRLTLTLRIDDDRGQSQLLSGLGFSPLHERFVGYLPTDEQLFQAADEQPPQPDGGRPGAGLWAEVAAPRFALAAVKTDPLPRLLPLPPADGPASEGARRGDDPGDDWLLRDGLAIYSLDCFLDPDLCDEPAAQLMERALAKRHVRGEKLRGMHAVLPLTDVTLVSLPDCVHVGWKSRYASLPPFEAYGPGPGAGASNDPGLAFGPRTELLPPVLQRHQEGDVLTLSWGELPGPCTVQLSDDPRFPAPLTLYEGAGSSVTARLPARGVVYVRARTRSGAQVSAWSPVLELGDPQARTDDRSRVRQASRMNTREDESLPSARLALHRALLRLCLARGDLFAVLSFPLGDRTPDVIAHVHALGAQLTRDDDRRALSYGAFYYPWIWQEEEPGLPRLAPPDGPVTGMIAAVARTAGAWTPPAYKLLRDAAELHSTDQLHRLGRLLDEGINVLVRRPEGGVLVRSATSISPDAAVRAIGVRRLLALLRRLIMREGTLVLFEPNDDTFRRSLERRLERLLIDLFVRGAFAGATPAESFEVAVDPAVNTTDAMNRGEVIIDVQVAPVQPLLYMTLRIVQAPGQELTIQEV
ncbi:MAG: phage tail sheath protein [Symbiobacteriaceae bacterium]|nr:phage tail sheath protein [Symbiobacteriaceae bacterium]